MYAACAEQLVIRSMKTQMAKHSQEERKLRSQVKDIQAQLLAAQEEADRKQVVVTQLSEVSGAFPSFVLHLPVRVTWSSIFNAVIAHLGPPRSGTTGPT